MTGESTTRLLDTATRLEAVLRRPVPPPPGGLSVGREQLLASVVGQVGSGAPHLTEGQLSVGTPFACRLVAAAVVVSALVVSLSRGCALAIRRRRVGRRT